MSIVKTKNNDNTDLSYTVPEGIIIVDLAKTIQ